MKIALLSDWFLPRLGGVELQIRDLAGELARRGHEVHVVTTTPADEGFQGALQTAPLDAQGGVAVHRVAVPLVPGIHITLSPAAGAAMRETLRRIAPDVVHLHASIFSTGCLAGGWAAHDLGIPSILTFHSVLGPWRNVLKAADLAFGWTRWPSVFSAVSATAARDVSWLAHGRPVELLPNGLDPAEWVVEPDPARGPDLQLVSVLRLQSRKRPSALVRIVAEAAKRLHGTREVRLTVIGDGPARPRMEKLAERLGIADAVEFTGYLARPEIRARFARAHAFLLVSTREAFGIAALEARAAGLPVVARGDTGMGELFEQGKEGLLATTDAGVVDHLVRLGSDPALLEGIALHNRTVPPAVGWTTTVAKHLELYDRAIAAAA